MRAQRILRSIPGQCPFVVRLISRKDGISAMKIEGQMRIPSGCAISAVISKEGNKMSGKMITESMKPMHDRSNGLGGGFAGYGSIPNTKTSTHCICFLTAGTPGKAARLF